MKIKFIRVINILLIMLTLLLLYSASIYSYLFFHVLAETFSICIAFTVFMLTWNSKEYSHNNCLTIIGTSYLFIGILDLFHTMSYQGMQIFKDYDFYANQVWVAARYFESLTLMISFAIIKSGVKVKRYIVTGVCILVTSLLLLSIYVWKIFPICFIKDIGLTRFKKDSEYIICLILAIAILLLIKNRDAFAKKVYKYLILSMILTIFSELSFTTYISNYSWTNMLGHYFKIASFYYIYKSIVTVGIKEPFELIFREMKLVEDELQKKNQILKALAESDSLTGLYNHKRCYELLEAEREKCLQTHDTFAVLILDIDHFKEVNDTWGHVVGDQVLVELSQVLKVNISSMDFAGRYGGEEFLVMLSKADKDGAYKTAENIRIAIEARSFINGISLTVSIGMAVYQGETISHLIDIADKNLYDSKDRGRNKITG